MREPLSSFRKVLSVLAALVVAAAGGVYADVPTETVMEASFDVGPGGSLHVDVPDADIVVRRGSSRAVEIEVRLSSNDLERARERFDSMGFRARQDGGDVFLDGKESSRSWRDWVRHDRFHLTAEIRVPGEFDLDLHTADGDVVLEEIRGAVSVDTEDGDIAASALDGEEIRMRTADGDIALSDLSARRIDVRTMDGDVSAGSIEADEIQVRTGDGDIALGGVSGALRVSTGDGDVHVGIVRLAETSIESGDGDVVVRLDRSAGAQIDLRGSDVTLGRDLDFDGSRSEDHAEGRIGGGGPTLRVRTGDGSILLRGGDGP